MVSRAPARNAGGGTQKSAEKRDRCGFWRCDLRIEAQGAALALQVDRRDLSKRIRRAAAVGKNYAGVTAESPGILKRQHLADAGVVQIGGECERAITRPGSTHIQSQRRYRGTEVVIPELDPEWGGARRSRIRRRKVEQTGVGALLRHSPSHGVCPFADITDKRDVVQTGPNVPGAVVDDHD